MSALLWPVLCIGCPLSHQWSWHFLRELLLPTRRCEQGFDWFSRPRRRKVPEWIRRKEDDSHSKILQLIRPTDGRTSGTDGHGTGSTEADGTKRASVTSMSVNATWKNASIVSCDELTKAMNPGIRPRLGGKDWSFDEFRNGLPGKPLAAKADG